MFVQVIVHVKSTARHAMISWYNHELYTIIGIQYRFKCAGAGAGAGPLPARYFASSTAVPPVALLVPASLRLATASLPA
eukprot:scaffold136371_cov20-Prasinocladus_malaysianus.AAC.1